MNHAFQQIRDMKCFQASIIYELKELGVKAPKYRKQNGKLQENVKGGTVFGCYLCHAPSASVTLQEFTLNIPKFLIDATSIIRRNIKVEGIFRKAGSVHRQNDIKRILEKSGVFTAVDVHDAANLLKQFLRHLAVPIIPRQFQECLLKALDLPKVGVQREAILLLCLLLPMDHLHTLRFVMDFFSQVADNSASNRMDISNLATVLTPNIFVLQDDYERKERDKSKGNYLLKQTAIVKFLIENANSIGWVPDHVLENCVYGPTSWMGGAQSEDDLDGSHEGLADGASRGTSAKKNRKKRNSLNGVFNGLRRMVQSNRVPTTCYDEDTLAPECSMTPLDSLKRKREQQQHDADEDEQHSSSKKRAVERQVQKTKSLFVPFHLDSPAPHLHDDVISLTPAPSFLLKEVAFPRSQTRKSGRIKFFKRKNSLSQTPKCKKDSKNRLTPSVKAQGSSSVGRRLSGEDIHKSPSAPLLTPNVSQLLTPFQTKKSLRTMKSKVEGNFTSYLVANPSSIMSTQDLPAATGAMRATQSAVDVASHRDQIAIADTLEDSLSNALDKVAICDQDAKPSEAIESTGSDNVVDAPVYHVDLPKPKVVGLEGATRILVRRSRRAARRSMSLREEATPLNVFETPVDRFARPWNNKSSLRRGRPNTVTTGLPAPSPFKVGAIGGHLLTQSAVELYSSGGGHRDDITIFKESVAADGNWLPTRSVAPASAKARGPREPSPFDALAAGRISKRLEFGGAEAKLETDSPVPFLVNIDSGILCDYDVPPVIATANGAKSPVRLPMFNDDGVNTDMNGDTHRDGIQLSEVQCDSAVANVTPLLTDGIGLTDVLDAKVDQAMLGRNDVGSAPQRKPLSGLPRDNVTWRNADAVINELKAASGGCCVGRPSLIRLMKDKAGLVSQTARRYDAIAVAVVSPSAATNLSVVAKLKSGSPVRIPEIFKAATPHSRTVANRPATLTPGNSIRRTSTSASMQKTRELYRATSVNTSNRPKRQPSGNSKHANTDSKENENCTPTRTNFVKKSAGGGSTPLQSTRNNSNYKARATKPVTSVMVGRSKSLKVTSQRSPLAEITPAARVGSQGSLRRSPRLQDIRFRSNVNHQKRKESVLHRPNKQLSGPRRSTSM